jgi:hypothetical protein
MSTPEQAPRIPPCPSCGGQRVGNLGLTSHHHVGLHPNGRSLWSEPMSAVNAVVCLNCSEVTLFAAGLDKIRAAAQEHPDWFTW